MEQQKEDDLTASEPLLAMTREKCTKHNAVKDNNHLFLLQSHYCDFPNFQVF